MTDKDPKDMTASELLRWATNGEPYNGVDGNRWTYPTEKIRALVEDVTGEWPSDHEAFSIIADKIDAELAEARKDAIRESKKPMWWFRNAIKCGYDWPEPRDGEKFRDYLHRCFLPRPRFEDGEPVQMGDEIAICGGDIDVNEVVMLLDGSGYRLLHSTDVSASAIEDRVKRPAPEVLGADGLPIKAGETVYRTDAPITEAVVTGFRGYDDGSIDVVCSEKGGKVTAFYDPSLLTHTPPDTQERINADAKLLPAVYYARNIADDPNAMKDMNDSNIIIVVISDLLRRQRELDKRMGGAE